MSNKAGASDFVAFLSFGLGGIIERKSGYFLTPTFNYERKLAVESGHFHTIEIVKRLLNGEIKLSQTPKKLYPYYSRGDRIIKGKPFSWKGIITHYQKE